MTLPENWWATDLNDEPCDSCGVKPSKHEGHGSYTCQKCYESRWCPKCHYGMYQDLVDGVHVCASEEELAKRGADWEATCREVDVGDAESFKDEKYICAFWGCKSVRDIGYLCSECYELQCEKFQKQVNGEQ